MTQACESAIAVELRWYWTDAMGDMGGLKSNFEAMRARMQLGFRQGSGLGVDIDERCIDAATREKRVRRALALVPKREATILEHAFGTDARELPAFGRATGVVPLTRVARRMWVISGTKRSLEGWLARLVIRVHGGGGHNQSGDAALLRAISSEAEGLLRGALMAYAARRYPGLARRRTAGERDWAAQATQIHWSVQ